MRQLRLGGTCCLAFLAGCGTFSAAEGPNPAFSPVAAGTAERPAAATPAAAPIVVDDTFGFRAGDVDLRFAGTGNNDRRFKSGSASANASVGYLVTDVVEVGVRQTYAWSDPDGGGSATAGATAVALDLHPLRGAVSPFFGLSVGRVYGDGTVDTWTAAPEVGVKWFVKRDAYLLAMAEYDIQFDHASTIDDGWHAGSFAYSVGIGLRF